MLRVRPRRALALDAAVMSDLSLIRYGGFAQLPEAAGLRTQLQREEAASLAHGIHLIAVQSADGSLVVGDSHHDEAGAPLAREEVDELVLRHLRETLRLDDGIDVVERWNGFYPTGSAKPCVIEAPDAAMRVVAVTSGTGASTGFAIAEEVIDGW